MDILWIILLAILVLVLMEGARYRRYRGGYYGPTFIYRPFHFWAPRPPRPPMGGGPGASPGFGPGPTPTFRGPRSNAFHAGGGRISRPGSFRGGRSFGGGGRSSRSFGGGRSHGGGSRGPRGGGRR